MHHFHTLHGTSFKGSTFRVFPPSFLCTFYHILSSAEPWLTQAVCASVTEKTNHCILSFLVCTILHAFFLWRLLSACYMYAVFSERKPLKNQRGNHWKRLIFALKLPHKLSLKHIMWHIVNEQRFPGWQRLIVRPICRLSCLAFIHYIVYQIDR